MASSYYEIYRGSPLGIALCDSLDDLVRSGEITEELGRIVLSEACYDLVLPPSRVDHRVQFDRVLADSITTKVDARASVKAHLHTYRNCDDVWYFSLRNATFKMHNRQIISTPRVKVVACKHGGAVALDVGAQSETPDTSPAKASWAKLR